MGGCCTLNRLENLVENEEVEIKAKSMMSESNTTYINNRDKIEKIQSYFRGMTARKAYQNTRNEISTEIKCYDKIDDKTYEEFLD